MGIKRYKPEEIVTKLKQVEVLVGQGMARINAICQISITEQTYYRWRKQYGGMGTGGSAQRVETAPEGKRAAQARCLQSDAGQVNSDVGVQGKLTSPARRRQCIDLVCDKLGVSDRRACRVLRQHRSTYQTFRRWLLNSLPKLF